MKPSTKKYFFIVAMIICLCEGLKAQVISFSADSTASLNERWKLARAESKKKNFEKGYWIGYSIERAMGRHSFIGSYSSEPKENRPSLKELITGMHLEYDPNERTDLNDQEDEQPKVMKEVGILFHFDSDRTDNFDNIKVSNLSLRVDLEGDPLIWTGIANHTESVSFLQSLYENAGTHQAKKHILMAIGLHNESPQAISFLKKILLSSELSDVRGEAAFWLGQTNNEEAEKVLFDAVKNDPSLDIRDKSIFALSQMKLESATEALIIIARTHSDVETRKKAIFWLGQKASNKAVAAVKDAVYKDENTEVQKSALFALTQLHDGNGVDDLITIAKTHPNPKLRKDAIFWLGQSENPKALEAIIDILRK